MNKFKVTARGKTGNPFVSYVEDANSAGQLHTLVYQMFWNGAGCVLVQGPIEPDENFNTRLIKAFGSVDDFLKKCPEEWLK